MLEQPIKAEPPREMSRDDRRVIFSKIDAVYLDEKRGYSAGWNDETIAKDLGVPRAWVTKIREENFGTEGNAEDVIKLTTDMKALHGELEKARKKLADDIKSANDALTNFDNRSVVLSVQFRALERLYK